MNKVIKINSKLKVKEVYLTPDKRLGLQFDTPFVHASGDTVWFQLTNKCYEKLIQLLRKKKTKFE